MDLDERTYTNNLLAFATALRENGVQVSTDDVLNAARALRHVDPLDRDQFYFGLKTTIIDEPSQIGVFDELFTEYWDELSDVSFDGERTDRSGSATVDDRVAESGTPDGDDMQRVDADLPTPESSGGSGGDRDDHRESHDHLTESRGGERGGDDAEALFEIGRQERSTTPSVASDGKEYGNDELPLLVGELGRQIGALRGFRRRVQPSGELDLRRSLSAAHGENPNSLPRVAKERSQTRVRFFVDVSHSMLRTMDREFLLAFLFECMRQFADVRIFLFDTDATEVTRHFQSADVTSTVEEMRRTQTEWGAGTTIGACLTDILAMDPFIVDRDTVSVVVSDGWDAGDADLLEREMRELDRRCRSVLWLNPRATSASYEPKVTGMLTALPFVDYLFGFSTVADLRSIVDRLRSQTARN